MAIRPILFNDDGSIEVWHDERAHGGSIQPASIRFAKNLITQAEDQRFIELACPVPGCDSVTTHPIAGGCDLDRVQRMFALKMMETQSGVMALAATGTNQNNTKPKPRAWKGVKDQMRQMIKDMDGVERFMLEHIADDVPDAGNRLRKENR